MKEKILYQLVNGNTDINAFPIDWNKIPEDVFEKISSEFIYKKVSYGENGLLEKSVVYFKIVDKFEKNIIEFDKGGEIFGIWYI